MCVMCNTCMAYYTCKSYTCNTCVEHLQYTCFTHVIHVYSLHMYCKCRNTCVIQVYSLHMYHMCRNTCTADTCIIHMFYTCTPKNMWHTWHVSCGPNWPIRCQSGMNSQMKWEPFQHYSCLLTLAMYKFYTHSHIVVWLSHVSFTFTQSCLLQI